MKFNIYIALQLTINSSPLVWSTDKRSFCMQGQFSVGPNLRFLYWPVTIGNIPVRKKLTQHVCHAQYQREQLQLEDVEAASPWFCSSSTLHRAVQNNRERKEGLARTDILSNRVCCLEKKERKKTPERRGDLEMFAFKHETCIRSGWHGRRIGVSFSTSFELKQFRLHFLPLNVHVTLYVSVNYHCWVLMLVSWMLISNQVSSCKSTWGP